MRLDKRTMEELCGRQSPDAFTVAENKECMAAII
jgi:hypothetical protein